MLSNLNMISIFLFFLNFLFMMQEFKCYIFIIFILCRHSGCSFGEYHRDAMSNAVNIFVVFIYFSV